MDQPFLTTQQRKLQYNQLVNAIVGSSDHGARYNAVKTTLSRAISVTPQELATLLSEGPKFISADQALELCGILKQKFSDLNYVFLHVLCARVLNYWQTSEDLGCGHCYYSMNRGLPNEVSFPTLMSEIKRAGQQFPSESMLTTSDLNEFTELWKVIPKPASLNNEAQQVAQESSRDV